MVPSTYENGKLFNVLPSGNRAPDSTDQNSGYDQTRADFDFDRGSNLAATRRNSSGLIEKGRENKLLQSNAFDTTWVPQSGITLTANQAGYDGTNDAWKLEKNASSYRNIRISVSVSGVHTTSVYAKAGTLDLLTIRDGSNQYARFYLSTGTYTLSNSPVSGAMVDVGNGWYRCSVTMTTSNPTIQIYPDWNQATAGYIYIQSAQLEKGLIATDYIASGATTGKAGILADMPRINYDANGENGALLLESLRTNVMPQSEYFGAWNANASAISSVIDNHDTSPEGVANASKINFIIQGDSDLALKQAHSVTGGATYTYSIYIKGEGSNIGKDIVIKSKRSGGDSAGTTTIQTLTGDWKRINFSTTYAANNTSANFFISSNDATSVLVYGAQCEAGSYVSSYIPTHGAAVSRSADSCSVTGVSDVIGQTEGTMYAEFEWEQKSGVYFVSDLSTGSTSNEILIAIGNTADNRIRFQIQNSGVDQINFNSSAISSGTHKVALAYKANDVVAYLDGVQVGTDTSATIPATSQYRLERANGTLGFSGGIKQTMLSKERLSNAELATLTTL